MLQAVGTWPPLASLGSGDLCRGLRKNRGCVFPPGAGAGQSLGGGSGAGTWHDGGNSWLPGPWYTGWRILMSIKRAFNSRPAASRGCLWRWAGTNPNSRQRKGPLWLVEHGCWGWREDARAMWPGRWLAGAAPRSPDIAAPQAVGMGHGCSARGWGLWSLRHFLPFSFFLNHFSFKMFFSLLILVITRVICSFMW